MHIEYCLIFSSSFELRVDRWCILIKDICLVVLNSTSFSYVEDMCKMCVYQNEREGEGGILYRACKLGHMGKML